MILSNYHFRNSQTWFRMSFPIIGICILVQFFCCVCVFFTKVKILMEERNTHDGNRITRPCLNNDLDPEASKNTAQLNVRDFTGSNNGMQMNRRVNKRNAHTNPENTSDPIIFPSYLVNNVAHNKILTEVYHILFITLAASIKSLAMSVKRNLSIETLEENSVTVLCFLDLAPMFLLSIVLPIAIHLGNPEIRKYMKSLFL